MTTAKITHRAARNKPFSGLDHRCRRCGRLIVCVHADYLPNGRDFFDERSGSLHRCRRPRTRRLGARR